MCNSQNDKKFSQQDNSETFQFCHAKLDYYSVDREYLSHLKHMYIYT